MMNNEATKGVVTRMQSLRSAAAAMQAKEASELDANNNDKIHKDKNQASTSTFCFDSSSKFNYLNVENTTSEPDNDQENSCTQPKPIYQTQKVPSQSVLKPLNLNTNQDQKPKTSVNYQHASHYYSHGNSGAIKRGCEDVENENEDDLVTSISSSTGCRPPKKTKFVVTSEEMNEYFHLINENEIQNFLSRDSCCLISDKYALAMVFTYFKRSKFSPQEYTKDNFYLALYLASDIEEDVDEYKYEIFPWALGTSWRSKFSGFLRRRDALLRRIGYRAIVSRKCCEEVMSFKSEHFAWKRERAEDHGGATRAYLINRSKRFLLSKSNLEDDELNLPRLPSESPRPCPLCLINRGWDSTTKSITLREPRPTGISVLKSEAQTSYNKGYSLIKRQKSNDYSQERTIIKTLPTVAKIAEVVKLVKTPMQKKKDLDSNSETESELTASNLELRKADSKMPASNKFLKVKLSTTELEQNHQESSNPSELSSNTENSNFSFVVPRHSSFGETDKFLIKDTSDTSDEEDSNSEVDDVFLEKHNVNRKKQEFVKQSNAKLRANKIAQQSSNAIKRRNNHSMSNASNYNLRSHSVNRIQ